MPNMMHGPRGVTNMSPGGPGGLPAGPAGQMCHNGNMVEMQQPFNQPPQQQQQTLQPQGGPMGVPQTNGGFSIGDHHNNQAPFNNNNAGLNNQNENFNEFNPMMQTSQPGGQPGQGQQGQHMDHPDQSWRSRANDIRLTLLNKLKEALSSLGQGQLAESYENEAFTSANNLNEYKSKLVQWLASIYERSSSANSFAGMDFKPTGGPLGALSGGGAGIMGGVDIKNSPPDSSTNGLTDMVSSTSPKVHDQSCNPNDLVESTGGPASLPPPGGKPEESMLATPKSESCLSPTSSPTASAVNSPLATTVSGAASAASSAASAASTTMTGSGKASSPQASSTTSSGGGTTFPAPMPPMDPSIGMGPGGLEQGSKTGNGNVASTQPQNRTGANPINSQQSAQPPPTNGTQRGKFEK